MTISQLIPRLIAASTAAALITGLGLATWTIPAAAEDATPLPTSDTGQWIVRLAEPSLAAREAPTDSLDVTSAASRSYLDHLAEQHTDLADRIGEELGRTVTIEHSYRNVLNAIAIHAEPAEVAAIAQVPGVVAVKPDRRLELTTDVSHEFVGSAAVWDGDTGPGLATRGEGTVIGVLDSGINPAHPAFAATDGEGYTHTNPYDGYLGVCDPAHPDHEPICNDKLVGAWSFINERPPFPNESARDATGHGSHTASIAAGNVHDMTIQIGADEFTHTVRGVAPRANIISYRVCHQDCGLAGLVAGVDQAVADGVDVLNFSISDVGGLPWDSEISLAFLEAYAAGTFVSAAAGNYGPEAGTAQHTAPWSASVAATTTGRSWENRLSVLGDPAPPELGDLPVRPGFGPGNDLPIEAEMIYSGTAGSESACTAFPEGALAGAVALIRAVPASNPRDPCPLSQRVTMASMAGAVAAVIYEPEPGLPLFMSGTQETEIPSFSVDHAHGEALRALVTSGDDPVMVRIGADTELVRDESAANIVSRTSSRGPTGFDLLAPDIAAPGVNILAAYHEVNGDPVRYEVVRGTSMAAPHVAGAGALLTALHPDWPPARIYSALIGTADPAGVTDEHGAAANPLQTGAGLLDVAAAGRIGLVLDESYHNMHAANPDDGGDPRALNVPYLVDQQCESVCTFTRKVTSVADAAASYTAAVPAPAGITATVEPATFTLAPGATQELTVTVDASGSSPGEWVFADLRLATGDTHAGGAPIADVHYPVLLLRPGQQR